MRIQIHHVLLFSAVICLTLAQQKTFAEQCPCEIFAAGGTPCVAAHSTTRALYGSYNGPLYQVRRLPDTANKIDIYPLTPGGVANSAVQDSFLGTKSGTISIIYDQSGKKNHLTRSQGGGEVCKHQDQEAVATALPLMLGGHKVYGIKVVSDDNGGCNPPPGGEGTGYRNNKTTGIATGDDPETMYMVTSGDYESYQNSGCCYDYGNAETTSKDDGAGTMETIYFGGGAGWGRGGGNGPWVLADMENGVFSGSTSNYTGNTSVPYHYVTAGLIGRTGSYALLAGNAQSGALTTMYDGIRPPQKDGGGAGYNPMRKQGAIVLGTGGDNSDHGRGYFFEGVMTTGAASIATMDQVHANIVAAGYGSSVVATRHSTNNVPKVAPACNVRYNQSTSSAVISYTLQNEQRVKMNIIDQQGRHIATIINRNLTAGRHETVWNAKSIPAGVYFWKMSIDNTDKWTGKLIVGK